MLMKCKPTWQFQSVEFDFEIDPQIDEDTQLKIMFETYYKVLYGLMKIAPIQDQKVPQQKKESLATNRQKELMDYYDIDYDDNTTVKEAQALIDKSIKRSRGY